MPDGYEIPELQPMKLTKEYILSHRTARGGFTKAQLAVLGVTWPPARGWLSRVVGSELSSKDRARFESGRRTRNG